LSSVCWAGVDVGGRRKGFHGAAVDAEGLVAGPQRLADPEACLEWLTDLRPDVVALDSPQSFAPAGERSRRGERDLSREVCGILWTPDRTSVAENPFHEWIVHGYELYELLEEARQRMEWEVVECFPTASWTVWAGARGKRSRTAWTSEALSDQKLSGLPERRLNQDDRDAIAAALTARAHSRNETRTFEEIVVPLEGSTA